MRTGSNKWLKDRFKEITGYEVDEIFMNECRRWFGKRWQGIRSSTPKDEKERMEDCFREYIKLPGVI
jgi:hypothetical protein